MQLVCKMRRRKDDSSLFCVFFVRGALFYTTFDKKTLKIKPKRCFFLQFSLKKPLFGMALGHGKGKATNV